MSVTKLRTALALMLLTVALPAAAQKPQPVRGPLASAKGLRCSFPSYGAGRFLAAAPPQVLTGSQEFAFQIDSIDYKRGQVRIVGEGNALATMRLTQTGMHIIEQTPIGNFTITSIFSGAGDGKTFLSVHSRHLGELDAAPRSSQAYGSCALQ